MTSREDSAITYRSLLNFPGDPDELFNHLDEQLYSWLVSKNVPWRGGLAGTRKTTAFTVEATEHHERDGSRTNAIRCTDQTPTGDWNVRLTAHRGARADPWLLTEVVSPLGPERERTVAAAPPRLVRQLLDVLPARDGRTTVPGAPAYVRADEVEQVVQAVLDPDRRGLLFVAGTPSDFPADKWCGYIARLVRDTVGLASTFVLDPEATRLAQAALGVHGPGVGYLRTYLRDVQLDDATDAARHRFLTPRTMTERPEGYLRRVLSGTARQQVVDRPVPPEVTRVLRRVARWHADEPDASPSESVGARSTPAAPAADTAAFQAALRSAVAASTQAERLRQQVDDLELELLRQDEQLQALQSERDDAQLDATAATDEAQFAADQVRYLRTQLMQAGAGEAAWTDLPAEQRTSLPESISELLERLPELRHVVFTGDEQDALDLDVTDTLGRSARKAWQAMLALDDYVQLKVDASFGGTVHDYCRETPGGCHGWSAERHASDESEQVKANTRHASARLLPVPEIVDPGGRVFMWAHFKLAAYRTVSPRMHYYDDTQSSGKVYVGYLGRHLPHQADQLIGRNVTYKRKLIEVALPLEAINRACQHEKSVPRKGHPATMHLWWARRPLAACRAVLFAQLVDDPSAHPDSFPTEDHQAVERKRLFDLIERLVVWENASDEQLLREARAEIAQCFSDGPPAVLDPFAGGGSIPLEAQRLGLEARASDLNPVAVLINKALIEIPPRWAGQPPVCPAAIDTRMGAWPRATGFAEDVRRYGTWMRDEAERRIGRLYPKATLADGSTATVIAWLWARTVTCPNPACGAVLPLVSSLWLSKKKGRPTWLRPVVSGKGVTFEVVVDSSGPPASPKQGRGAKFACLVCGDVTTDAYVKAEGMAGRMGQQLLATVTEGRRQRVYLSPTSAAAQVAEIPRPDDAPDTEMAVDPRNIWCVNYGLSTFADLFTARQLTALTTFSTLVGEAWKKAEADAQIAGVADARQYAADVATCLSFAVSKLADWSSSVCSWIPQIEGLTHTFSKQAIPMTWDFTEINVFSSSAGNFVNHVEWVAATPEALVPSKLGSARQSPSTAISLDGSSVVATDPPYYDNIGYSDLSDFFYVWLRRSLRDVHPQLLATVLTPKSDELIASPYRFGGSKAKAEAHFESGFIRTFERIRKSHPLDVPITVFYAFKQAESDAAGIASTGWETMLNGLIEAGLSVTATWPMRTERSARSTGIGTNALASSIVLACRAREATAAASTRRGFLKALKDELPNSLREMQQGSLAPVDLAQAAIGPGMAVFTRYSNVLEADGSAMTVRTALALINHALDEVLSEQEGDFSAETRFCLKWFSQFGWDEQPYGVAESLSKAVATSVDGLVRGGAFWARAGKARLVAVSELSTSWDPLTDDRINEWEVVVRLARALEQEGVDEAVRLMSLAAQRVDLDTTKELAYLLYSVCEKKGWTTSAALFNGLGTSWSDLASARGSASSGAVTQGAFELSVDDEGL